MTLKTESQIDSPERSTAGLASTTQLVDRTGSTLTLTFETSSASSDYIQFLQFGVRIKPMRVRKREKRKTRRETFRENLRKAMRMNAEILSDLARY